MSSKTREINDYLGDLDAEVLLHQILDTMANGLFTVDTKGTITSWNGGMEAITGYSAEEALGESCAILEGECSRGCQGDGPEPCPLFAGDVIENKRCSIRHRGGVSIVASKQASLMRNREGEVIGGIEVVTDMSDLLELRDEVARLKQKVTGSSGLVGLVGRHPRMQELYDSIHLAARSPASVLLLGETGTGKELAARAIHELSDRREGPFVEVSCAALPESLLESELFGHARGAFTGAVSARKGRFEEADGGTLFLDEIGDISPEVQKKLLRALQFQSFERVGESNSIKVDIRIIAATNRDLPSMAVTQEFRPDLYYRLAAIPIVLPPLRERKSDIALLIEHFMHRDRQGANLAMLGVCPDALERLMAHDWPGNVRELQHAVQYAGAVSTDNLLGLSCLPPTIGMATPRPASGTINAETIHKALEASGGHKANAARLLGVSRVTLWKWMKRLEIVQVD